MLGRILPKFSLKQIDRGWDALKTAARNVRDGKSYAKVGVLGSSTKAARRGSPLTSVDLALIHEFGTARIPERSFIRSTFERKKGELILLMARLVPGVYAGTMSVEQMLNIVGAQLAAEMKNTIREGIAPPLALSTLARRTHRHMERKLARTLERRTEQGVLAAAAFGGSIDGSLHGKLETRLRGRMNRTLNRRQAQAEIAGAAFGISAGEEKPLIDTGQLVNSITWAVVKR